MQVSPRDSLRSSPRLRLHNRYRQKHVSRYGTPWQQMTGPSEAMEKSSGPDTWGEELVRSKRQT